jgi:putative membrane protein
MNPDYLFFDFIIMIFGALFLAFIVITMIRLARGNMPDVRHRAKPLDIAKERYAKGELTKEEFEKLKKDLAD